MTTDVDPSISADLVRPSRPGSRPLSWAFSSTGARISVPAWAEPTGPLGAVPEEEWFRH